MFKTLIVFLAAKPDLGLICISNSSEKNYYKDLITDWSRIFPDKNRNAAGPKFFKYIIDKKITYKLVGQDEADIKKNLIFFKSPIGKALIGKDKSEMVTVNTPSGEKNFEILDVEYI